MAYYERRLPHWHVIGKPLFVTFRLKDSLPEGREFPSPLTTGESFSAMDRVLDKATSGPIYLSIPEVASMVVRCLRDGESRFHRYQLHSFVVMPNHVHILATPIVTAEHWLGPLKGFSAYQANRMLGRRDSFWQRESYDHLVRSPEEFDRIKRYIENNPVRSGLASEPQEFRWSSAAKPAQKQAAG
jgi:putative DNA methylase